MASSPFITSCPPKKHSKHSMNVHGVALPANPHTDMEISEDHCFLNLQDDQYSGDYTAHTRAASCANPAELVALAAQSKQTDYSNGMHYAHLGWQLEEELVINTDAATAPSPSFPQSSGHVAAAYHQLSTHDQGDFSWSLEHISFHDQHFQVSEANTRAKSAVTNCGDVLLYDQFKGSSLPSQMKIPHKPSAMHEFQKTLVDEKGNDAYNKALNECLTTEISGTHCAPLLQKCGNLYINTTKDVEAIMGSPISSKQLFSKDLDSKRSVKDGLIVQTRLPNSAISARSWVVNECIEKDVKRLTEDEDEVKEVMKSRSNIIKPATVGKKRAREASCRVATSKAELAPPGDVIHVRARRGQATDSHSLAERVRRERISQRMKLLQDLVPSCSKVLGKAAMLEEIINYVKSLQHQVEFLSMRLAASSATARF